jgi:hypothetical protein
VAGRSLLGGELRSSGRCNASNAETNRKRSGGMDLVTISDHNTLEGALRIAHLPGTFLSEELTTRFPEDGVVLHVPSGA